jgi:hypothetical protein
MNHQYAIKLIGGQKQNLYDKLVEIDEGDYDRHPKEQVNKVRRDIINKINDLDYSMATLFYMEGNLNNSFNLNRKGD